MRRLLLLALLAAGCHAVRWKAVLACAAVGAVATGATGFALAPEEGSHLDDALVAGVAGAVGGALVCGEALGPPERQAEGTFSGRPGYLLLAGTADSHDAAAARAEQLNGDGYGVRATVVQSDLLGGFAPGAFLVVVGAYRDEGAARSRARSLHAAGLDASVAVSGPIQGAGPVLLRQLVRVSIKVPLYPHVLLRVQTPDGAFSMRSDPMGEFWVATPGTVTVAIVREQNPGFPGVCTFADNQVAIGEGSTEPRVIEGDCHW